MRRDPVRVAVVGCGGISDIYMTNLKETFYITEMVGCSDLHDERSTEKAAKFGIKKMTTDEIMRDPSVEIVVNLTYPDAHFDVTKQALLAGKHVYCEKMMAAEFSEGQELAQLAKERNLMYCVAPDTFLGGGLQTVRKYIDSGLIGTPFYVNALVVRDYQHCGEGPDLDMPFIMTPGGGIPYDMGGYYLHGMINALGSITRVSGFSKTFHDVNPYWNPRHLHYGEDIHLNTPTSVTASLEFACGAYGTLTTASVGFGETSRLEFYGTEGTIIAHDPNYFGETMYLSRKGNDSHLCELPFTHGYTHGNYRGIAVADMAWALRNGRKPRASYELGLHALEVVHGVRTSCEENIVYEMQTRCDRPEMLPTGFTSWTAQEACLDN